MGNNTREGKRPGKMKGNEGSKDSTINKNNLKYKCKHWQTLNQMCLFTTFGAVQIVTLKTKS